MDWYKNGLCNRGYYIGCVNGHNRVLDCTNCKPIENLISSIGDQEFVYLYRSLDRYEKAYMLDYAKVNYELSSEDLSFKE